MSPRSAHGARRCSVLLAGWLALPAAGCLLITDFDVEPRTTGGGGAGTGAGGAGGGGATGGGSATGGGLPCGGADLTTDPENCGACGFSCATACVAGRCPASLDLGQGGIITSVLVEGDTVFFVRRNGADPDFSGTLWTVPVDFDTGTVPALAHPVENAIGSLAVGAVGSHRVYFAGQLSKVVYACNASDCLETSLGASIQTQVNGMAAVGDTLYVVAASGDNRLVSFPLDAATGAPLVMPTYLVDTYAPAITNAGVLELFHVGPPSRLFWASYDFAGNGDGCVYRAAIASLPISPMACWSPSFTTQGFNVAADGTVFAQNGATSVDRIGGSPPTLTPFATNATYPRAVDGAFLYATDAQSRAIRAYRIDGDGTPEPDPTPVPPDNPTGLSAAHPLYLYYAAGSALLRWTKPAP